MSDSAMFSDAQSCKHALMVQPTIGGVPGHEHVHANGPQRCQQCGMTMQEIEEAAFHRGRIHAGIEADPPPNRVQQTFFDQNERQAAQYHADMRRAMLLDAAATLLAPHTTVNPVEAIDLANLLLRNIEIRELCEQKEAA